MASVLFAHTNKQGPNSELVGGIRYPSINAVFRLFFGRYLINLDRHQKLGTLYLSQSRWVIITIE